MVVLGMILHLPAGAQGNDVASATEARAIDSTTLEPAISQLDPAAEEQLRLLIEQLKNINSRKAKQSIKAMGKDAVPLLIASLDEKEVVQAQQIIEILGKFGDARALPRLMEMMKSDDNYIRSAAIYGIGKVGGKDAVPILTASLFEENCRVCEIAIETLVSLNDSRAIPGLIAMLQRPEPELVDRGAKALATFTGGSPDYGTDWMSWHLWYESDTRFNGGADLDLKSATR